MAKAKRRLSTAGEATRQRIVAATLRTLEAHGIVGTSARAIAAMGEFNQTLIFYHFGTVDDAIAAAVSHVQAERIRRDDVRFSQAESLVDLMQTMSASTVHPLPTLTQAFAGAAGDDRLGQLMHESQVQWQELLAAHVQRVVSPSCPVRSEAVAAMISGALVGASLLDGIDPDHSQAGSICAAIESVVSALDGSPMPRS